MCEKYITNIYDLSNCEYSDRHGTYGGAAGDKDGILINGEYWIAKYPKPEREFDAPIDMSYNTSPLSEYIGSHIYEILGVPVHETILGIRNDKLVVACKDFCEFRGQLTEMNKIKNGANQQLEQILDKEMHYSSSGERVNLNEMILHLEYNPMLKNNDLIKERFWETAIIDVFIDNNDRNNGNWGLLFNEKDKTYDLAPVYDNGNSFFNKMNDDKLEQLLEKDEKQRNSVFCGSRTAYDYNGHIQSAKKLMKMDNLELQKAANKIIPIIHEKMEDIKNFIDNIPEKVEDKEICSPMRKECYKQALESRLEYILEPMINKDHNIACKEKVNTDKSNVINVVNGELTIPEKVLKIKDNEYAFRNDITSINFLGNATSIGKNAFLNCKNLKFVDIPESMIYIAPGAFKDSGLEGISITSEQLNNLDIDSVFEGTKLDLDELKQDVKLYNDSIETDIDMDEEDIEDPGDL